MSEWPTCYNCGERLFQHSTNSYKFYWCRKCHPKQHPELVNNDE